MTWSLQKSLSRKMGNGEPDIFRSLRREMDHLFDDFARGVGLQPEGGNYFGLATKLDVTETDDALSVTAELPGVEEKDVEVSLAGDMLTIKGEKKHEHEEKKANYHLRERSWGSFERNIVVPFHADPEKVTADFKKGVLTVTVPKPAEAKTPVKKISVTTAA